MKLTIFYKNGNRITDEVIWTHCESGKLYFMPYNRVHAIFEPSIKVDLENIRSYSIDVDCDLSVDVIADTLEEMEDILSMSKDEYIKAIKEKHNYRLDDVNYNGYKIGHVHGMVTALLRTLKRR